MLNKCRVGFKNAGLTLQEVLSGGVLLEEYRPDLYNMILDKLTPDTIRVAVIGKKFDGTTTESEQWYGTKYSILDIPEATLEVIFLLTGTVS